MQTDRQTGGRVLTIILLAGYLISSLAVEIWYHILLGHPWCW